MEAVEEEKKSLERVLSQKALQMSSSFPCQICVVGFLCGVCLASLFLALLTSFGSIQFGGISFSTDILPLNSPTSKIINTVASGDSSFKEKRKTVAEREVAKKMTDQEKVLHLYSAWGKLVNHESEEKIINNLGVRRSSIPRPPHLHDCRSVARINERQDKRSSDDGSSLFPPWTIWRGSLDLYPASQVMDDQFKEKRHHDVVEGAYPPWVSGSDEENYPLTRKLQRDIWLHQHPVDCKNPKMKFLVVDWERLPGFGIGAQIAGMCGLLAIAINEDRVLITNHYNRADHDGCKGSSRSSWSCYFLPETSMECRDRAFEIMKEKEAWENGIVKVKSNYTSKQIWAGQIPRKWGSPWSYLQPTTEVNGSLLSFHRKMDRRWWRAQAVRYLMRFPSEYMCNLMNEARQDAFGKEAAELVLANHGGDWPKEMRIVDELEIERYVWWNHKPWMPRPMLSMHVRMGDKACEMKIVEFVEYMKLADRIRTRFPNLNSIWLSTEMQEVIDKTKSYPHWNFYFSRVNRQVGNITMAVYESSLGRKNSTNYPLVNFLMAAESDFFIGALGSTWCFLIDGMRNTGGKVMAGYLSVNKDRFW